MNTTLIRFTAFVFAAMLLAPLASLHAAGVANLRCEYRENPQGIDVPKPRLSWVMEDRGPSFALRATAGRQESGGRGRDSESKSAISNPQSAISRGQRQAAYQVLVASTPELLTKDQGDLWDSGKVESDRSIQVEYAGKPLEARIQCYWKVRVWTSQSEDRGQRTEVRREEEGSGWSKPAFWTMGLLKLDDPSSPGFAAAGWRAKWVGYDAAYQATPDPYNPAVIGRLVLQFESGEDLVIPIDDKWKASQQAVDGWDTPAFDEM